MNLIEENLKKISLFQCLNSDELNILRSFAKIKTYMPGSVVFYENDKLENMYFLTKGEVKLYKVDRFENEIFLNRLKENSFIYTVSNLYHDDNRGEFYNVESISECEIILINVQKFKSLFLNKPNMLKNFLDESFKLILHLQHILNRDIVYDGTAKVAHMICSDLNLFNNMKKHEIAYCLHIQPETLSRIIKKLINSNCITVDSGKINIKDIKNLKELYE